MAATATFNDPRRFGCMKLVPRARLDQEPLLRALGPEPLGNEFDAAMLAQACAGKKTSLKAALLDQRVVAGLGNIYVCEALHRSHLSPKRKASTIADRKRRTDRARAGTGRRDPRGAERCDQGRRLVAARPSPDLGRTRLFSASISGSMTARASPVRRPAAAASIRRIVQSGRSTFYCPVCQK